MKGGELRYQRGVGGVFHTDCSNFGYIYRTVDHNQRCANVRRTDERMLCFLDDIFSCLFRSLDSASPIMVGHVSGDTRHRHFDDRHECYMYGQLYGFATHMNARWTWCVEWLVRHGHSHL